MNRAMNCNALKVAFAGTPEFAAVALQALINSPHHVVGVLTQPDRKAGRGRKLMASPVKQLAQAAEIPVLQPPSLRNNEAIEQLDSLQVDVLVVAAYGLILPDAVLRLPPLGCVNIHASLLPRWRGAAPIHRAVLAGDVETGVCIMQMDSGLDTGDILLENRTPIHDDDTTAVLHDRLADMGAKALLQALPGLCDGSLPAVAQPTSGVTYADKLSKAEAVLDFAADSIDILRRIRAFNPWPVAEARLLNKRVRIWTAEPVEQETDGTAAPGSISQLDDHGLVVATGDGALRLTALQWPGKPVQAASTFAQGRNLVGERFDCAAEET